MIIFLAMLHTVVAFQDVRLAKKAQNDRLAAAEIMRRLQPKIFQVVRSIVRSSTLAEEYSQTVSLEVLKSLPSYRGEAPLESWAGGVAYKTTMKHLKRDRKREQRVSYVDMEIAAEGQSPEQQTTRAQLYDRLREQLGNIPEKRRTSLLLHLVHGFTVAEVSETMGVSPNTTKDRLKTALRELRAVFDANPELKREMLEEIR